MILKLFLKEILLNKLEILFWGSVGAFFSYFLGGRVDLDYPAQMLVNSDTLFTFLFFFLLAIWKYSFIIIKMSFTVPKLSAVLEQIKLNVLILL